MKEISSYIKQADSESLIGINKIITSATKNELKEIDNELNNLEYTLNVKLKNLERSIWSYILKEGLESYCAASRSIMFWHMPFTFCNANSLSKNDYELNTNELSLQLIRTREIREFIKEKVVEKSKNENKNDIDSRLCK